MLKLYTAGRSGNAHKVRLALNLMKVPYEEVEMSFEDGSIKAADFLAKNPRGQVPAIEDGDEAIWDSAAILIYLARKHGGEDWLPTDPAGMAHVMEWLTVGGGEHLLGLARCRFMKRNGLTEGFEQAEKIAWKSLDMMESHLKARDWLAGRRLGQADLIAAAHLSVLDYFGEIAWASWPGLKDW
ncbi:MAG: glutathione S-transferase family protein, partial [Rhodospirillaceae bacterium]|nr:glutathione S-transferase family protein [Rhodospirillaceae bacterium]